MTQTKKIILIPYWITEALKRAGLPASDALNLKVLKNILSVNDLVMFLALQKHFERIVGCMPPDILLWMWTDVNQLDSETLIEYGYQNLLPLSEDVSLQNELSARLFDSNSKSNHYEKPFIVCDITPDVAGIVIYPGYFDKINKIELQKKVVEEVLRILYVYCAPHVVADTVFFKRYLELLSAK